MYKFISLSKYIVVTLSVLIAVTLTIGGISGLVQAPRWMFVIEAVAGLVVCGVLLKWVSTRVLLTGWSALIYVVLFAPIFFMILFAFNSSASASVFTGFSLQWFQTAWGETAIQSSILLSLKIALGSAVLSVGLGTAAALLLARAKLKVRVPYESVMFLAIVIPELMIAIGLLLFAVFFKLPLGEGMMMLGHAIFGTSLVTLIVRARYVGMGNALELASLDLGATPASTFRQITLPRLAPAVIVGFLLAFTFSFDDVIVSQFVSGSNDTTWPLYIYSAIRFGVKPDINATAAVLFGITLVVLAVAALTYRRMSRAEAAASTN